jgi:hypothetical protein
VSPKNSGFKSGPIGISTAHDEDLLGILSTHSMHLIEKYPLDKFCF